MEIVDSHVHFSASSRFEELRRYEELASAAGAGIVSLPDPDRVNFNPEAFAAKSADPRRYYVFAGFDYTHKFHPALGEGGVELEKQVERLALLGADGIKMWAGKPSFQRRLGESLDSPTFAGAYEAAARFALPIVLHVADPKVFWASQGARFGWSDVGEKGDAHGEYPSYDELQRQAETVVANHRATVFIFPHLLFRADDLDGLASFIDRHANVHLDLSPGLYFYGDLHQKHRRAREFFADYRGRLIFGSDGMWFDPGHPYLPFESVEDNLEKTRRLLTFLGTRSKMENPFSLTRDMVPVVEGLALGRETLEPILRANFRSLLGGRPKPLDRDGVAEYALEIGALRRRITDAKETQ